MSTRDPRTNRRYTRRKTVIQHAAGCAERRAAYAEELIRDAKRGLACFWGKRGGEPVSPSFNYRAP